MSNHIMVRAVSSPMFAPSPIKERNWKTSEIGVLCKAINSEWAAQGFAVPKKEQAHPIHHQFSHAEQIPMPIPISVTFNSRTYKSMATSPPFVQLCWNPWRCTPPKTVNQVC
jgi:hypothetical protein